MKIKKLVKRHVETLDAYINTNIARQHPLIDEGIVIIDNKQPLGVVTSADLTKKQHNLLIDCMTEKPRVAPEEKVSVVLDIIKQTGHRVLPVYDAGDFIGTISQSDLLGHLQERLENQKKALQAAAHDLKSPINTIRQLCSLLTDKLQQADNLDLIYTIHKVCDYAQKITDDILFTEQAFEHALQMEATDLNELVKESISRLELQMVQKNLSCHVSLSDAVILPLDRHKFLRAIENLITNSIKFTHSGGHITIKTKVHKTNVLLSVEDNGIGISKKDQKKIFDQFTTAKRTGTDGEPTTGLGLYFTRQIAEAHGGSVNLQSEEKAGSIFTIMLPVN